MASEIYPKDTYILEVFQAGEGQYQELITSRITLLLDGDEVSMGQRVCG